MLGTETTHQKLSMFCFLALYLYDINRRQWYPLMSGLHFVNLVLNILAVTMVIL